MGQVRAWAWRVARISGYASVRKACHVCHAVSRSLLRRNPLQRSHCHACYSFSINKDIDREGQEGVRGVLSLYGVMFPRKRDKRDKRDIGCSAGDLSVTASVTKLKKRDT